jgi:type II secretory pathway pseudopilin PulG
MADTEGELQLDKLGLETEKLRREVESLKMEGARAPSLSRYIPLISVLVTVAGFGFGIYQYRAQQIQNRESQERLANQESEARQKQSDRDKENAQREFMKPLLDKQLSLYFEASSTAATIVNTTDEAEKKKAINNFWRLYYGPLVMVESTDVSGAMKLFGFCLDGTEDCDEYALRDRALALATSLQKTLLNSWNMKPEDFTKDKFQYPN